MRKVIDTLLMFLLSFIETVFVTLEILSTFVLLPIGYILGNIRSLIVKKKYHHKEVFQLYINTLNYLIDSIKESWDWL